MARLLLLIAIAIPLWVGWQRFKRLPAAQRKKARWQVAVAALLALLLLLVASGRLPWLMALFAALIPLLRGAAPILIRVLPGLIPSLLHKARHKTAAPTGADADGQSSVNTDWLELLLDHRSGQISGNVLKGPHSGRALDELSADELLELYHCCEQNDSNSAQLLSGYLDQRLGENWQQQFEQQRSHSTSGTMQAEEARAILGVDANATREQILTAHRRLMQKLHPDRGGNDYLAAQLNRARDCLLS